MQAYERYVALNGEADNDWEASELLRLGLSHIEGLRLRDMIAAAPALKSDVELTEALLGLDWPEFKDLSDEARERWLAAITNLSHPRVSVAFGELRWAQAVEGAGEAVASELRARVTGPFGNWLRSTTDLRELARRSASEGRLVQELGSGRVTLGSIVRLISSARTRSGELGPRLDGWLSRTAPLKEFVCNDDAIQTLEQLAAVRNPSSHGRMTMTSEKDALAAYSRAGSYLRQMSTIRRDTNENG